MHTLENKKLISIIVPVYNVENYLRDCLNSILNQTYNHFEIILINDGSTDNSLLICEEYTRLHDKITLISQNNQGLSAARNKGIEVAVGEYISFIDSDDLIHQDYLKILSDQMINSDISICEIHKFYNDEYPDLTSEQKEVYKRLSGREMNEYLYSPEYSGTTIMTQNKLFKKNLWNNYRFPLGILHEDCAIIYKVIDSAQKVTFLSNKLYMYRQRSGSITAAKTFKNIKDEFEAINDQITFFEENGQKDIANRAKRYQMELLLHPALDKTWNTYKNYSIFQILNDDIRTSTKIKLIKKKIKYFFTRS